MFAILQCFRNTILSAHYKMKIFSIFLLTFLYSLFGFAQPYAKNVSKAQVIIDAEKMVAAFLKKDFKTFVEYTYPALLEKAGGKENFRRRFEENVKAVESQGTKYDSVIISDPSKTVVCNNEMQCVLRQEMVLSPSHEKPFRDITYLIAISNDNGKSWRFLNSARLTLEQIKMNFPNICDSLPLDEKYLVK